MTKNDQSSVMLWARAAFTGTVGFEYGTDPDFVQDPDGVEEVDVEYFGEKDRFFDDMDTDNSLPAKIELTGLLPGTQYYYRACRDSGVGLDLYQGCIVCMWSKMPVYAELTANTRNARW